MPSSARPAPLPLSSPASSSLANLCLHCSAVLSPSPVTRLLPPLLQRALSLAPGAGEAAGPWSARGRGPRLRTGGAWLLHPDAHCPCVYRPERRLSPRTCRSAACVPALQPGHGGGVRARGSAAHTEPRGATSAFPWGVRGAGPRPVLSHPGASADRTPSGRKRAHSSRAVPGGEGRPARVVRVGSMGMRGEVWPGQPRRSWTGLQPPAGSPFPAHTRSLGNPGVPALADAPARHLCAGSRPPPPPPEAHRALHAGLPRPARPAAGHGAGTYWGSGNTRSTFGSSSHC